MIKNIVFDFGGVIADLTWEGAVKSFTQMGLKNADQILDRYHQTGFFQDLEEGKISESEYAEKLSKLCGRPLSREEIMKAWLGYFPAIDTRKLEFIDGLHSKYKLYILSNTNPYIMSWANSRQFSSLGKPLSSYFDDLFLSYELGYTKPDERLFQAMLKESGINPAETLFIDDGPSNTEAASRLGINVLLVGSTEDWREKLQTLLSSYL